MSRRREDTNWRLATLLAVFAGLLYCSWPLSYIFNPAINHGLASDLEASGQPYNWLFVVLDLVSGAIVCGLSIWFLKQLPPKRKLLTFSIIGFGIFGLFTIIDALVPLDCVPILHHCTQVTDDPWTVSHDLFNLGSLIGLTASIWGSWWVVFHKHRTKWGVRWLMNSTAATWFAIGIYSISLLTLYRYDASTQHIFIIICSVWTALVPFITWQAATGKA